LKLQPGLKIAVIAKHGVLHLIALKPIKGTRGLAKGVKTANIRDGYNTSD
jgi:hypothetical protein